MVSVRDMIVHRCREYTAYENFEDHLLALLVNSPIAVLVPSFPSLFGPPHPDGLHYPTLVERTQIPITFHLGYDCIVILA
ncbi:unnamed protein product [Eruca vesicaria subsp. sativa]|uniref:Uncharacterized protein n=1 Tax=Eruca vesicaria subsp. sativa TaxID=29727 RepID=A0ABC8JE54_ERUVS|nr:unnamed protein product [Eruca vesicaria subsp. sativa]